MHLHRTHAAALPKFQRLYALSGNRIVLRCTAPLATPPFCGMRKTSEADNIRQYYQPVSRRVLPPSDIIHETPFFSNINGTDITIKAAAGQTQSQSFLIGPRIQYISKCIGTACVQNVYPHVSHIVHNGPLDC